MVSFAIKIEAARKMSSRSAWTQQVVVFWVSCSLRGINLNDLEVILENENETESFVAILNKYVQQKQKTVSEWVQEEMERIQEQERQLANEAGFGSPQEWENETQHVLLETYLSHFLDEDSQSVSVEDNLEMESEDEDYVLSESDESDESHFSESEEMSSLE